MENIIHYEVTQAVADKMFEDGSLVSCEWCSLVMLDTEAKVGKEDEVVCPACLI